MTALPTHPWMDASKAPIYVWRWPKEATVEELNEYYQAMFEWFRTVDEPIGTIVNATAVMTGTPLQRQAIAQGDKRLQPYVKKWLVASGFVVRKPAIRAMGKAILWLSPPSYPHEFFESEAKAYAWVAERLGIEQLDPEEPLTG